MPIKIPYFSCLISRRRGQKVATSMPTHAPHGLKMFSERVRAALFFEIPDFDCRVAAARCQNLSA